MNPLLSYHRHTWFSDPGSRISEIQVATTSPQHDILPSSRSIDSIHLKGEVSDGGGSSSGSHLAISLLLE